MKFSFYSLLFLLFFFAGTLTAFAQGIDFDPVPDQNKPTPPESTAPETSSDVPLRETQLSLNGTWDFAHAPTPADAEKLADFYRSDFPVDAFKATPVPSNWAVLGYEEPVYRGFADGKASEGFYRREFTIPRDWAGKRVLLHFGGVWSSAEVWLNGEPLGRHDSGYTSFAFDVSRKLKAGKSNLIAVRVRQVTREYKFDVYDDWTLGGIYRDVWLEAMPAKRWLDYVIAQTDFDDQYRDAELKIRTLVCDRHKTSLPGNYPSPGEPYNLRFTLTDPDGKEVVRQQLTLPAHISTGREVGATLRVVNARPWTAETPNLYTLRVELLEKGTVTHTRVEKIGFREISTTGGVFRINGQAVKLRGVNRHDEHPDVGRATTRAHWEQDLRMMKAANINYIRLAHYPPARGFIELCDELGMYVGNEVPLGGGGALMYDPSLANAVYQRSHETVMRDINSPSIIYWSVGNEDPLTAMHLTAVKNVKALDPTRPVLLPWRWEEWLPPEVDILAPHYWKPEEYDRIAAGSKRPIITTEYTHAYGKNGLGSLESRWKALTRHPAGAGAAVWLWADQGIKTPVAKEQTGVDHAPDDKYLRIDDAGWDGIVDSYRNPTRDYWEVKAVYAPVAPVVNEISFVPGVASVLVPIRNDYDFTNLDAVKIDWSLHEDGQQLASGEGRLYALPHATANFELPLEKLKTTRPGKTYYARFIFTDATGAEINRRTVELLPQTLAVSPVSATKPNVIKGDTLAIEAAGTRYVFDPKTGLLVSAARGSMPLVTGLRPTLWRELDPNEAAMGISRPLRSAPDLNRYTPTATEWKVTETNGQVVIAAIIECVVNEKNRFTTSFHYTISGDGSLSLRYEIRPQIEVPWVPIVGVAIDSAPGLDQLHWLGLGPFDAYPNKRSAPVLGLWGGSIGSEDVLGVKAMRWVERAGARGLFRVTSTGYLQIEPQARDRILILSGVVGRPEKGRKAEDSIPQLEASFEKPFVGELMITIPSSDNDPVR